MNWDDETSIMGTSKSPRKSPKKNKTGQTSMDKLTESLEDMTIPSVRGARKTGKWGDESGKGNRRNSSNLIEQERFYNANKERTNIDSDDDDILVIPDIDDLPGDRKTFQSSHTGATIQQSTYKELNNEFINAQKKQNFGKRGKLNTTFLLNYLMPECHLNVPDDVWTDEILMQNVLKTKK